MVEVSLRFDFYTTNNHPEYEAVITGPTLEAKMGQTMLNWEQISNLYSPR